MDRDKFDQLMKESVPQADEIEKLVRQNQADFGNMQFGFDVVEVQRVGLQAGDVLMVTVKNDDLSQDSVDALRKQLQAVFPNNKVFVFAMGTADDVNLSIVSQVENPIVDCNNVAYCSNCSCGKKEKSDG